MVTWDAALLRRPRIPRFFLDNGRFSWRLRAYAVSMGSAIVLSMYATTASGSRLGSIFPQLTASPGVAPESPPVSTRASVTWRK